MRALIMKDLMGLKSQKNFIGILFVFVVVYAVAYINTAFIIAYAVSVFAIISTNTIECDKRENALAYLFALPVDRSIYAKEKYVFGGIVMLCSVLMISVISLVATMLRMKRITESYVFEWKWGMALAVLISILLLAVIIPVRLKYSTEKGRIVLCAIALAIVSGGYLLDKVAVFRQIAVKRVFEAGITLQAGLTGVVVCIAVIAVSLIISVKIVQNKEF